MSVPPQPYSQTSQPPVTQFVVNPQPTNNLGLAGFITSLLGVVSCGLLSPVGLLLSLIGLSKQPRGFAVAGTILGLLGSIFMVLFGVGIVLGLMGLGAAAKAVKEYADTHQQARKVYIQLDQQRQQQGGTLDQKAVSNAAVLHVDPWGTPFRAMLDTAGGIVVTSAGRDKKFDTNDDLRFDEAQLRTATTPTTQSFELDD